MKYYGTGIFSINTTRTYYSTMTNGLGIPLKAGCWVVGLITLLRESFNAEKFHQNS